MQFGAKASTCFNICKCDTEHKNIYSGKRSVFKILYVSSLLIKIIQTQSHNVNTPHKVYFSTFALAVCLL